ncbi:hypothetical protein BDA96_02G192500 [Sorghum bicolor]|uniref:Uncharacterized protein n=2 Tax=Sorghum bicolor TaxID=4558 RepID=A0A921UU90_SORBI|nr:hypothetical protein BDA96_02G192500 [Sorghum bicolor]OQU89391.1 hypothetical protein SORBI_3002G182150 [Sorghum bicolor]
MPNKTLDDHLFNRAYPILRGAWISTMKEYEKSSTGISKCRTFFWTPNSSQNCNNDLLGLTKLAEKLQCATYISGLAPVNTAELQITQVPETKSPKAE